MLCQYNVVGLLVATFEIYFLSCCFKVMFNRKNKFMQKLRILFYIDDNMQLYNLHRWNVYFLLFTMHYWKSNLKKISWFKLNLKTEEHIDISNSVNWRKCTWYSTCEFLKIWSTENNLSDSDQLRYIIGCIVYVPSFIVQSCK